MTLKDNQKYTIRKIRNGCWQLEWEDGRSSFHSLKGGAEKMVMLINKNHE